MSVVVNSNIQSLNALNKLNNTSAQLAGVFERVSSGLRINKAADDAAGLGVAESLDAEIRAFKQGIRNANDGISIVQTAEGSANEVANIIKRMRELAMQSASETLATAERGYVQDEFTQLSAEVQRIADTTVFNGLNLAIYPSNNENATITVQIGAANTANDRIDITLGRLESLALGVIVGPMTDEGQITLNTTVYAQSALTRLDIALNSVNQYRSTFGAIQNRLESAIRHLSTYTENLQSAKSRVLDADFAHETAQLAKFQILQQSGVAVLGQANTISQAALRLLG